MDIAIFCLLACVTVLVFISIYLSARNEWLEKENERLYGLKDSYREQLVAANHTIADLQSKMQKQEMHSKPRLSRTGIVANNGSSNGAAPVLGHSKN